MDCTNVTDRTPLERRARRNVALKTSLFVHASVYALVNVGLLLASLGDFRLLRVPLFGWGLGLAIHAAVVAWRLHGGGLRRRLLEREIESLERSSRR
jgi:hypothetical protein